MSGLGNKEIMSKNIQRLMAENGKDRNDICSDLGFKYTTFADWVNGKTYPRIDKIEMMANYFHVSKSDLVEEYTLDSKDNRDIKKDLDSIIEKLNTSEYGPAAYDGQELSKESLELFKDELEIALKRLKIINKEKYNPNKNKK